MEDEYVVYSTGSKSTWLTTEKDRKSGDHFVYILECRGGVHYCGITKNIVKRLMEHDSGKGCVFTSKNPIVKLKHLERVGSYSLAINRETELKRKIKRGEPICFSRIDDMDGGH